MGQFAVDNPTPLAFEALTLVDEDLRPLLLLVAKGTWLIDEGGLRWADEQVPISAEGEFWGKPGESSYKYEPEIAPFKVATDVALVGHAHALRRDVTELTVTVRVGPVSKAVRVIGDRVWFKSLGSFGITRPLSFDRMPLTWQENSLRMEWCLNCHRNPENYIRPRAFVTAMGYQPAGNQVEIGRKLMKEYNVLDARTLTSCSTCHR